MSLWIVPAFWQLAKSSKLAKLPDLDDHSATYHVALPDKQYLDGCEAVASVNRCLLEIGETPIAVNAAPSNWTTN